MDATKSLSPGGEASATVCLPNTREVDPWDSISYDPPISFSLVAGWVHRQVQLYVTSIQMRLEHREASEPGIP